MRTIFLMLMMVGVQRAYPQFETSKQIYASPALEGLLRSAKTVAILPFRVAISYKKIPKGMTPENIREDERKESIQMQQGMYTYLLRKADSYTVTFQDVDRTNRLLKQAGLFDRLEEVSQDSLYQVLGVDALIKADWNYTKTGSEAASVTTGILLGVASSTASGLLVMKIYGPQDQEPAWRMTKEMNENAFSSANQLMERMMKKVARNFPFEK